MAAFETAYENLLQGVSQQIPRDRLPGQVQAQVNMLSDLVTGIRRRPGAKYAFNLALTGSTTDNILAWHTDIAGTLVHVILNCSDGQIKLLDSSYNTLATLAGGAYLTTPDRTTIKAATVGDEFFLLNTNKNPTYGTFDTGVTPDEQGAFYVVAGAFSKEYSVTIRSTEGVVTLQYSTPDGATAGDAALATPEYIATQLYNQLALLDGYDVDAGATVLKGYLTTANNLMLEIIGRSTTTGTIAREVQDAVEIIQPDMAAIIADVDGIIAEYPADLVAAAAHANAAKVAIIALKAQVDAIPTGGNLSSYADQIKSQIKLANSLAPTIENAIPSAGTLLWLTLYREGSHVYIKTLPGIGPLTVSTNSGNSYLVASKVSYFTSASLLPAQLPVEADGYIVSVGDIESPQYFKYNAARAVWLESGEYKSPLTLTNMPVAVTFENQEWVLKPGTYEGRFAGDIENNPDPSFIIRGITGVGAYQGRLILLAGPLVNMSAAGKPRRFYRSTVSTVLDGDPIEIGSSANSSAAYVYAVPYMRDLILFSARYQALVPSTGNAITPRTANVLPTSTHAADMTCAPVLVGRTLMYPTPRSADFFGVFEMLPSTLTENQYLSVDSTQHIPKYMGGRCRFAASSGVAGLALFGPSGDKRTILVHEYLWDNETKQQQAWHQWLFPYDVATAYFANEIIHIVFVKNGLLVGCTIDPRVGTLTGASGRRPFLDLYSELTIVDHVVTPPAWLGTFDPAALPLVKLALTTGALAGEEAGATVVGSNLETVLSHPSGEVALGFPFKSSLIPTRPIVRDFKDRPIGTQKHTVQRFIVGTANSAEYTASVSDLGVQGEVQPIGTLYWSSSELQLGEARVATESFAVVPARTNANSTVLEVFTEGVGELNIVSIEHVDKFHQKVKRR